jgi:hypothetical protein
VSRILRRAALATASLGAVALVAGMASTAASASPAGVSSFLRYTASGSNSTAGWFGSLNNPDGTVTHVEGFVGESRAHPDSLSNLGVASPSGPAGNGAGYGLCDTNDGNVIRAGVINVGGDQQDVVAEYGNLGAALYFGDPCANGVANTVANSGPGATGLGLTVTAALNGSPIPDGQTIDVQVLSHRGFGVGSCPFDTSEIAWQNVTADPGIWNYSCVDYSESFNEPDWGVIGDTQGMAPPAVNSLVSSAHVGISEDLHGHAIHGSFQANSNWTVFPVDVSTNGLMTGSVLIHTNPFKNDGTGELAGTPVS